MAKIKLEVVTVEKLVYSDDVDEVIAPGTEGELGILPHHAPLITMLEPGALIIKAGGQDIELALSGGYMEVRFDRVIVLADAAERAEEIDVSRAEAARLRAQKTMAEAPAGEGSLAAEAALKRSLARLKVAQRRRREKPV